MKMNSIVEQLIELLQQEAGLYRSIQVVIDREKEAAIRSDLNALNQTGIEKEKILIELHRKEEMRHQLVAGLAEKLGYAAPDLTLSQISQLADEPLAGRLRQVSKNFSALLSQVQAANGRNKQIFEHSRELLRGSINLLNELLTPNTVYFRTGNIQGAKSIGKCVCSDI
jgi:flagellar biosynthesis/type III secretory pathway chaperone